MSHQAVIEVFRRIENEVDVNSLRVGDVVLWPYLRLLLWPQLQVATTRLQVAAPPLRPGWFQKKLNAFKVWREKQAAHKTLSSLPEAEVLFLSRVHDYSDCFTGSFYNRHLDPMIEHARKTHSCLKLEVPHAKTPSTMPRAEHTIFFDPSLTGVAEEILKLDADLESALDQIEVITSNPFPNRSRLRRFLNKVLRERAAFMDVLDRVKPRAVFFVCYYDPTIMAMISACHARGIPAVDVQHGKGGPEHAFYTNWSRIPAGGYDMVPDYFWVWGAESARNMLANRTDDLSRHLPLVGGNRWIARWQQGTTPPLDASDAEFVSGLKHHSKVVLLSLQPLADNLPDHLLEGMRDAPGDWFWLVRAHPHLRGQLRELSERIRAYAGDRFEMERSTRLPLYALLRASDYHVTGFSTVAFEAPYFGVATTFFHPLAPEHYEGRIGNGWYSYATTAAMMLEQISAGSPSAPFLEAEPYIETSDAKANAALDVIFSKA